MNPSFQDILAGVKAKHISKPLSHQTVNEGLTPEMLAGIGNNLPGNTPIPAPRQPAPQPVNEGLGNLTIGALADAITNHTGHLTGHHTEAHKHIRGSADAIDNAINGVHETMKQATDPEHRAHLRAVHEHLTTAKAALQSATEGLSRANVRYQDCCK